MQEMSSSQPKTPETVISPEQLEKNKIQKEIDELEKINDDLFEEMGKINRNNPTDNEKFKEMFTIYTLNSATINRLKDRINPVKLTPQESFRKIMEELGL